MIIINIYVLVLNMSNLAKFEFVTIDITRKNIFRCNGSW